VAADGIGLAVAAGVDGWQTGVPMRWQDHIEVDPHRRSGKPVVRGTRMTVTDVLDYLAGGTTEDELLADFPYLTREGIRACIAFAADRERRLMMPPPDATVA